jgi:gliding motility-associated-like protein
LNKSVLFLFFICICASSSLKAQENLVPNGSFEYYTQCPDDYGQINRAFPWYQPNMASSDYYNSCVVSPGIILNVDVPSNSLGFQYPHTGDAYCGFEPLEESFEYFEYIATKLIEPLEADQDYCVSIWLSMADTVCLSTSQIGVYFSNDSITSPIANYIDVKPQVIFSKFVTDQEIWSLVQGNFFAKGGERFMAIGVFDTLNIDTLHLCNDPFALGAAYYYIDDISLKLAGEDCNFSNIEIPNVFTPNKDFVNDTWYVTSSIEMEVQIFNRWGNLIFEEKSKTVNWNGENNTDGVYFYRIKIKDKIKTGYIHLIRE